MQTTHLLTFVRRLALVTSILFVAVASAISATYTALYAFGDSLSDLGNTYNALGGSGSDSTIYSLLGYTDQPGRYDDGRWSNGPVWVEHVNDALGLPPLQPNDGMQGLPFGTNFAFGGSESGTGYLFGILPNLQTQVSNMIGLAGGSVSHTGLYTVWSGGNDVINYIFNGNPNTPAGIDGLTTTMADNISTAITTLYNAGAGQFLCRTCLLWATSQAT